VKQDNTLLGQKIPTSKPQPEAEKIEKRAQIMRPEDSNVQASVLKRPSYRKKVTLPACQRNGY
jgi:hypothetical protein